MSRKKRIRILENIKIDKIGYGGVGIGTLEDGKKVIVKGGALPGSIINIRVTKNKKDFVQWHILKIKKLDPEYSDGKVFCPHYFTLASGTAQAPIHTIGCGWCKRQIMSYEKQLKLKDNIVQESFQRLAKVQEFSHLPIVGSALEKNYRNKIEFSFGKYITWKLESKKTLSDRSLGFHKQWEFSKIVDIQECGLVSSKMHKVFAILKTMCHNSWLPVRDQKTSEWFFRHLVLREWVNTNQLLVNLAIADDYLALSPKSKAMRTKLQENIQKDDFLQENISTFVLTQNNWLADTVKGPDITTSILRWKWFIYENLIFDQVSIGFRVSPFSFFQTNTLGAQQLFGLAADYVWSSNGTILDLYCGTGSIGLSFLKMWIGKDLIGIEIVDQAIQDAKINAEENWLDSQSYFVSGAAENILYSDQNITPKLKDLDLVILDPPRTWLHTKVIDFLIDLKKQSNYKLLYISCNPVTMARDIQLLAAAGMQMRLLQAVDMFPQTHHIECIGILK